MSEAEEKVEDFKIDLEDLDADTGSEEAPEYSEIELQAMEHGWSPEGVEGKRNLSAEEFLDRQPLYDDLKAQKKQIKQLREGVEALKQHNATIAERERAKLVAELKAAKAKALEQENYEAVVELDDRIAQERVNEQAEKTQTTPPAAFNDFIEENPWYNQDNELREFADALGTSHYKANPHLDVADVYSYVAKQVKSKFPEKFGNPRREQPSPVEGASKGRRATSKQYSAKDLPESDRQIMKTIVRTGAMTEKEYLKQYFGDE